MPGYSALVGARQRARASVLWRDGADSGPLPRGRRPLGPTRASAAGDWEAMQRRNPLQASTAGQLGVGVSLPHAASPGRSCPDRCPWRLRRRCGWPLCRDARVARHVAEARFAERGMLPGAFRRHANSQRIGGGAGRHHLPDDPLLVVATHRDAPEVSQRPGDRPAEDAALPPPRQPQAESGGGSIPSNRSQLQVFGARTIRCSPNWGRGAAESPAADTERPYRELLQHRPGCVPWSSGRQAPLCPECESLPYVPQSGGRYRSAGPARGPGHSPPRGPPVSCPPAARRDPQSATPAPGGAAGTGQAARVGGCAPG
jgi:hypothetical protein